jgi:hypothetical protein
MSQVLGAQEVMTPLWLLLCLSCSGARHIGSSTNTSGLYSGGAQFGSQSGRTLNIETAFPQPLQDDSRMIS